MESINKTVRFFNAQIRHEDFRCLLSLIVKFSQEHPVEWLVIRYLRNLYTSLHLVIDVDDNQAIDVFEKCSHLVDTLSIQNVDAMRGPKDYESLVKQWSSVNQPTLVVYDAAGVMIYPN